MGLILIIFLVVLLVGGLPRWNYNKHWGYGPSSVVGVLFVIALVLLLTGYLPRNF